MLPPPRIQLSFIEPNTRAVVVPSIHEPFGIVNLEVMAAGTPLLCSRTTGMAEVVPKDACWSCGTTSESISTAIADLRDRLLKKDPEIQERVERARLRASEYSWEKNARQYLDLYRSLLPLGRGAAGTYPSS